MKPKKPAAHHLKAPALALASLALIQSTAHAATIAKANNSDNLNLTTSWTGSVVPGTADIAQWDSTVTDANTTLLGGNLSFAGLKVTNPTGAVTISAGDTLTVGTSGIDLSSATQSLTIGGNVALKGGQAWSAAAGQTLNLSGNITKSGGSVSFTTFNGTLNGLSNDASGIVGPWATKGAGTSVAYATLSLGNVTGISAGAPISVNATLGANATTSNYRTNGSLTMTAALNVNTLTLNSPSSTQNTTRQIKTQSYGMKLNGILSAGNWTNANGAPASTSPLYQIGNSSAADSLTSAPLTIGDNRILHISGNGATQRLSATLAQSNLAINIPIADNPNGSSSVVISGQNAIANNTTSLADSVIFGTTSNNASAATGPYNTFTGGVVVASGILRTGPFANLSLGGGSTISPGTQASPVNVTVEKGAILRPDRNVFKGNLTLNGAAIWSSNGYGDQWQALSGVGSIALGADSVFYTSSSGNFTVSVPVTGPGGLTKTGSSVGLVTLNGNNTYTGPTKVWGGVLAIKKAKGLYNGDTSQWTASNITVEPIGYSPAGTAPSADLNPTLLLSVGGTDEFTSSQMVTLLSNLSAGGTGGLRDGSYFGMDMTNATSDIAITSDLSRAVNFKYYGKGNVTLSGNNSYTGKTAVDGVLSGVGTFALKFASLNSVTTNSTLGTVHSDTSSLGAPTTVANGTIDLGNNANNNRASLIYTGTGETTDRVINFSGQIASNKIDHSGTGLLKFVSPFTFYGAAGNDYDKDVILQGDTAGTGEIASAIADPVVGGATNIGISKRGSGTWTLSGNNTFTGATAVWNGKLIIGGAGTLGGGSYTKDIALSSNFSPEPGGGSGLFPEIFFNSSANQTLSGFIYSNGTTGTLRKAGAGTLTLAPKASVNAIATATANLTTGVVTGISITPGTGTGYDYGTPITVTISGGGGSGATATSGLYFFDGTVNAPTITNGGSGYTSAPTVTITAAPTPYRTNAHDETIVEAGVLATNGYALYDDSTLTITDGKVSVTTGQTEIVKYLFLGETGQLAGTYGPTDSGATNIDDVHFAAGSGTVTVTTNAPVPVTGYTTWANANYLTGDDADPTADPDGDGMINALESVLGGVSDIYADSTNSIGLLPTSSKNANGDMVFTFNRTNVSKEDTTLVFQWSTDLTFPAATDTSVNNVPIGSTTATTNGVTVTVTANGNENETVVVTVPSSKAANGKIFGRLSATVTQ